MSTLTTMHQELARVVVAGRELGDVLHDITGIARRAMPGTEAASITLLQDDDAHTAAYDGQLAMDADELQYEQGYGPCMDAGRAGEVLLITDMAAEERWPGYTARAIEHGVGSSLSLPLPFRYTTVGALNAYASAAHAFSASDVDLGEEVATWVALAISNAEASTLTAQELRDMRTAMVSRAVIEQAKGVLVERYKVTADQAFTLLARASQHADVKLRDVADELVRTGVLVGSVDHRR
jgi:GAF domain-containing protein